MSSYYLKKFDLAAKPDTVHLFLTEGEAEVGFIDQYLTRVSANLDTTTILCFEGLAKMTTFASTLAKLLERGANGLDQLRGVGLMADAETNHSGRLAVAIQCGTALGFTSCSKDIRQTGRHESNGRRFAVSLSPSNNTNGRIENLLLQEIAADPVFQCIEQSFDCIEVANGPAVDEKARVQMFISAKANSNLAGIRHAFGKGIFQSAAAPYDAARSMIDYVLAAR
jgi:hypothetical protein